MSDLFQEAANAANVGGQFPERYKGVISPEKYAKMVARLDVVRVRLHLESLLRNAEKKANHRPVFPIVYDTNVPGLLVGSPDDRSLVP